MNKPKWPWRDYLTEDETAIVAAEDAAKTEWQRLVAQRAYIQNRAIQRAKYAAHPKPAETEEPPHGRP